MSLHYNSLKRHELEEEENFKYLKLPLYEFRSYSLEKAKKLPCKCTFGPHPILPPCSSPTYVERNSSVLQLFIIFQPCVNVQSALWCSSYCEIACSYFFCDGHHSLATDYWLNA